MACKMMSSTYLLFGDLYVSYEKVHQLRQYRGQKVLELSSFSKYADELKHSKYHALLTYDLSVRVTCPVSDWFTRVDNSADIAGGGVVRKQQLHKKPPCGG